MIETSSAELVRRGHEVFIFAPGYGASDDGRIPPVGGRPAERGSTRPAGDEPRASEPFIYRFPSLAAPNYPSFRIPIPVRPGLSRFVAGLGLDVIHSHTPFVLGRVARSLARRLRVPLVFTHHTLYHEYVHYALFARRVARWWVWHHVARYCRDADLVIAPSEAVARQVREGYGVRTPVEVIPSGVDLRLFEASERDRGWLRRTFGLPPPSRLLVNVGRLTLEKNPGLLLSAFARLAAEEADAYLVLVGEGPERPTLERRAFELGLAKRVVFTGRQPPERVADALLASDLFVITSYTETQGLVVAEALAAGLPVVLVDSPPLTETVRDGVEGLVVPGEAQALAAACRRLLNDPELRRRMSSAARERARELSLPVAVDHLLAAYELVVTLRTS